MSGPIDWLSADIMTVDGNGKIFPFEFSKVSLLITKLSQKLLIISTKKIYRSVIMKFCCVNAMVW
jgi:hypothetical protein